MNHNIEHQPGNNNGRFNILTNAGKKGEVKYEINESGEIVINHTRVDEDLKGSGASVALLDAVAGYARLKEKKIITVCSFAQTYMRDRHLEKYQDVLA